MKQRGTLKIGGNLFWVILIVLAMAGGFDGCQSYDKKRLEISYKLEKAKIDRSQYDKGFKDGFDSAIKAINVGKLYKPKMTYEVYDKISEAEK